MSVRILHAADLHLDAAFEGLSPEKAALRRAEFRRLPSILADEALRLRADLLFLAGDIFDSGRVFPETAEALRSALSRLTIPVFIAPGNHDYYSMRSPWAETELPGNVRVFTKPELECVPLEELGVNVWGAGYTSASCPPLLRGFSVPESGRTDLLVLHAEADRPDSPYCPVTAEDLSCAGFAYAALGHVHSFGGPRRAGGCVYAWPGCCAGRGFDECGEKGALIADVSDAGTEVRFLPLGQREYRELSVRAGSDPLPAVTYALPRDAERCLYRVTLTGETEEAPDLAALAAAVSGKVFDLTLRDATYRPRTIDGSDTLRGIFLRRMRERIDAAPERDRPMLLEALRLGLDALDGREGPV